MSGLDEKELYKVKEIHEAFYTGGVVQVSVDGSQVFCQCGSSIQVLGVEDGKVLQHIGVPPGGEDTDPMYTFYLSDTNKFIVTSHKSGLLKLWKVRDSIVLLKQWKSGHIGSVVKLAFSDDDVFIASGGSSSRIRLWHLPSSTCVSNLSGSHGVISVLKFCEAPSERLLLAAGDDFTINAWSCQKGTIQFKMAGHYSRVTGLGISYEHNYIVSCSRDKVLILWSLDGGKHLKTLALHESIEALSILPSKFSIPLSDFKASSGFYVAVGGENGVVSIWDVPNGRKMFVQSNSVITKATEENPLAITHLAFNHQTNSIFVVSVDHNIIIHDLETFTTKRQFVGFNDEVISVALLGKEEDHLAVATNSSDIKLYQLSSMSCSVLKGHSDFVMALAVSPSNPQLFASASKDRSIRVWLLEENGARCVASGSRHSDSVLSLVLCSVGLLTASKDTTLKLWKLPSKITSKKIALEPEVIDVKQIALAHSNDINDIGVSPNDKLVATASADKTAKLWRTSDLSHVGTLQGHKRGLWSCRFSPVDQVLLTTSTDSTLKLWSVADLSCLKTLEGHESSVLQGLFLTRGTQILSSGGDGLLKLWSIKTSECVGTFDSHIGKIWALTASKDEKYLYSGGNDSWLVKWEDWSEQTREEKLKKQADRVEADQKLSNLIHSKRLLEAISLAISLDRPKTLYLILEEIVADMVDLKETVNKLTKFEKEALLQYCAHWNANSKFCCIAQMLISILIVDVSTGKVEPAQEILEAIIPYTERHYRRITQLIKDLYFIKYIKHQINPITASEL